MFSCVNCCCPLSAACLIKVINVNEFKLELNYSSIVYYSRNKQASANL